MERMLENLNETTAFLQEEGFSGAEVGIVLGTGLGALVQQIDIEHSLNYKNIPHFPLPQ